MKDALELSSAIIASQKAQVPLDTVVALVEKKYVSTNAQGARRDNEEQGWHVQSRCSNRNYALVHGHTHSRDRERPKKGLVVLSSSAYKGCCLWVFSDTINIWETAKVLEELMVAFLMGNTLDDGHSEQHYIRAVIHAISE